MKNFCFVVMPFSESFNEIYKQIYIPAIQAVGLEPLRADAIYDNQSIIHDIIQSIKDATVILAEVTGRNPNVNYELGMAHALEKEVVIVTSNKDDVPSDYCHLRYIHYNPGGIGWDRKLSSDLTATLRTVFDRLDVLTTPGPVLHLEDGFYEADIVKIFHKEDKVHYFYRLNGVLPLSELGEAESYLSDESHWLADWNQEHPRFKVGETVKFKVTKVSGISSWAHVKNARNVNFVI